RSELPRANCGSEVRREGTIPSNNFAGTTTLPDPPLQGGKEQQAAVPRMTALAALICRDVKIALRVGGGALIGVLFFLTVVVLMPFAVGPDLALLTRLGPAILWLGALLASLLTLDRLFMADHDDGSLDLIAMSRTPLELACAAKALAHWLAAGLPLIIATPVLGLLLNLDATSTLAVAPTLLAG